MSEPIIVAALYKFVSLPDFHELREPLLAACVRNDVKGTLLLAEEGINGTIAGSREGIDAVLAWLKSDARLADLRHKESQDAQQPFLRMKVKLKKEIVTMGITGVDPVAHAGHRVRGAEWNALLADPDVVVVDTRNDYEVALGTFKGAINPNTDSFREFPEWVEQNLGADKSKKVAMFCTGGIRCEKASAWMRSAGYNEVYQLDGGILDYLAQVPEPETAWEGECFVFDNRVSVDHDLQAGSYQLCHGCRRPIDPGAMKMPQYEAGVSCHQCFDETSDEDKARFRERQKQIQLAKARNEAHLGSARPES